MGTTISCCVPVPHYSLPNTQVLVAQPPSYDDSALSDYRAGVQLVDQLLSHEKLSPRTSLGIAHAYDCHSTSWNAILAEQALVRLAELIRRRVVVSTPFVEAVQRASEEAKEFAIEHEAFGILLCIGVCVVLMPWMLEWLVFAKLGPLEGSWAAAWMARYAGYVPKKSLYSYLQRLGMKWGRL